MKLSELIKLGQEAIQKEGDMDVSVLVALNLPPITIKHGMPTIRNLTDGHGVMVLNRMQFILLP